MLGLRKLFFSVHFREINRQKLFRILSTIQLLTMEKINMNNYQLLGQKDLYY